MPAKIADVAFRMEFEEAKRVVNLGAGVEDLAGVVSETCKVNAVFLAGDSLGFLPLLDVEYMHGLIVGGSD